MAEVLFRWRWAIVRSDLASTARLILLTLSLHMKTDGSNCFVSLRTLARETHLHRSTIIRQLRKLDGEWIRVVGRESESGDAASNIYFPLIPKGVGAEGDHVGAQDDQVGALSDQGGRTVRPGVGAEGDQNSTGNSTPNTEPPISDIWSIWIEELGGDPPHPKLGTGKRRKLLKLLWDEQLRDLDDPLDTFRSICRAVRASEFHMKERAYQLPESLFRNAEKRETWTLKALNGSGPPDAHDDFAEQEAARRRALLSWGTER